MITMFLMIHTMIMVWSSFFLFFRKKLDFLSLFSQIVAAIYQYKARLTAFRGIYAFLAASQQT